MTFDKSDSEGLLSQDETASSRRSDETIDLVTFRPQRRNFARRCAPLLFHLVLITCYTTIFFVYWDFKDSSRHPGHHKSNLKAYSPAWDVLEWEPQLFENQIDSVNPFKGPPRPELDDAWNKLLGPSSLRVDKETLDKINRTSVALADGSGYMVGLDVYHQLHCLRYVRRYLHRDYYNMSEVNLGQHIDHCLDTLRQYVMCNADLVLQTFDWIPNFHRPWPNFRIVHECANWDAIEKWAWDHYIDGYDENLVKHPDFHPELPNPFEYTVSGNSP